MPLLPHAVEEGEELYPLLARRATTAQAECRATLSFIGIHPPATGSAGLTGNGDAGTALAAAVLAVLSLGTTALLLRRPGA